MIPEYIKDFILSAANVMTSGDIAEELSISPQDVSRHCKTLGIKPISRRQLQKHYMLNVYKQHTAEEIAAKLEIGMPAVWLLAEELGIMLMTNRPKHRRLAALETLSAYRFASDSMQFPVDPRSKYHED